MNRTVRLLLGVLCVLCMAACSVAQEAEPVRMNAPQETIYASFDEILMEWVAPYLEPERLDYTDVPIDVPYESGNINSHDVDALGYAYVDLNGDGQNELLLGNVKGREGQISQVFSMADGIIYQLWDRDDSHQYDLCVDGTIRCRWGETLRTNAYGRLAPDGRTLELEEAFFFERDRDGAPVWFSSKETLNFPERGLSRKEMKAYQILSSDEYDAGTRARASKICAMTTLQQWCDERDLTVMDIWWDPWSCGANAGILLPYTSYGEMLDTWKRAEAEQWPYETVLGYPYGYPGIWGEKEHYNAQYATLDINGDGVEELLCACGNPPWVESGDCLCALYTMRDGHVLQMFLIWGDREWWQLCEEGVLVHFYISGASSGGCSLWKLAGDRGMESLGSVSYRDGEYFDGDWYPPETAVKITKTQYNAFCNQYRVLEETELPEYTRLLPPQRLAMDGLPEKTEFQNYSEVIAHHVSAIRECQESGVYDPETNIPVEFYQGGLSNVGYAILDIDGDGTEELVFGTVSQSGESEPLAQSFMLEVYTTNFRGLGSVYRVLSGGARYRYYLGTDGRIIYEGSGGAANTEWFVAHFDGDRMSLRLEEAACSDGNYDPVNGFYASKLTNLSPGELYYEMYGESAPEADIEGQFGDVYTQLTAEEFYEIRDAYEAVIVPLDLTPLTQWQT